MARIFVYDDREFPDPDAGMTVDEVKATLSDFYGEIANASVKETKRARTPSTSSSAGWAPRGPSPASKEGIRWTPAPLPGCWRPRRRWP